MMGLKKYDYEKLLHDLKRLGQGIQIIEEETDPKRRKVIADLLRAESDRMYSDIEEMREGREE